MLTNLIRVQQLTIPIMTELFERADEMRRQFENHSERKAMRALLAGTQMHTIFYEKSLITRLAFETAALRLGMAVVPSELSLDGRWETPEDFLRVNAVLGPDVIILRHPKDGVAERAQAIVDTHKYPCHIINAGIGRQQHPSQALVDAYTIHRQFGSINGLTIVIGGDLANGRAVQSLVYLLSLYKDVRFIFVSPLKLVIGSDLVEYLLEHDIAFEQVMDMGSVLPRADVVYWTRLQLELISDTETARELHELQKREYTLREGHLGLLKPHTIIMHPFPRSGEISPQIDADPRAFYFVQAQNGLFVRMALLSTLVRGVQH